MGGKICLSFVIYSTLYKHEMVSTSASFGKVWEKFFYKNHIKGSVDAIPIGGESMI